MSYMTSFFNLQNKSSKNKPAVEKHPILGFPGLVNRNNRQKTIEQIAQLLDLSRNNFDRFCIPLIKSLFEWAQNLPATENSYYSNDATLIDHLLQRTLIALRNCSSYFTLHKENLGLFSKDKNAWLYMLFCAGMLQGIGNVVTDMEIKIYDDKGENPKSWSPFSGSMRSQGTYFSYHFYETTDLNYKNRATLFLATQLMPQKGLEWLINNPNIFATWLALLDEDEEDGGAIQEILQLLLQLLRLANAKSIEKYFYKIYNHFNLIGKEYSSSHNHLFGPSMPTGEEVPLAYQMTNFLRQSLEDGTIKIGLSSLQAVQGGLLILPETARLFFEKHPHNIQGSWEDIQADIVEKKLCVTDRTGKALRTFTDSKGNTHTGVVLDLSKFHLPENVSVISPGADETIRVTRSQFFSLPADLLTHLVEHKDLSNSLVNTQNLNLK